MTDGGFACEDLIERKWTSMQGDTNVNVSFVTRVYVQVGELLTMLNWKRMVREFGQMSAIAVLWG